MDRVHRTFVGITWVLVYVVGCVTTYYVGGADRGHMGWDGVLIGGAIYFLPFGFLALMGLHQLGGYGMTFVCVAVIACLIYFHNWTPPYLSKPGTVGIDIRDYHVGRDDDLVNQAEFVFALQNNTTKQITNAKATVVVKTSRIINEQKFEDELATVTFDVPELIPGVAKEFPVIVPQNKLPRDEYKLHEASRYNVKAYLSLEQPEQNEAGRR